MNLKGKRLSDILKSHSSHFYRVVRFDPIKEKLISFDFTEENDELQNIDMQNIPEFSSYISNKLKKDGAKFGFGGYDEIRFLYKRSNLFDKDLDNKKDVSEEPRRLHIGIDIWGDVGTEIFSPLDGRVHSFAFNDNFGDYGATIILEHELAGHSFFTLYGHVSLADIDNIKEGFKIKAGQILAHFGEPEENGYWPPHLHFQIIEDIAGYKGDYPGVCKLSQQNQYLENSPDPDLILGMKAFIAE